MVADSELPQHEAPRPSIEPRATLGMPAPERKPLGLRIAAWSAGVLLLGVLASWTHHAIDSSLREPRAAFLQDETVASVQVLDRAGRVSAALPAPACAQAPGEALRAAIARAAAGETRFVPPSRSDEGARPLLWFVTPIEQPGAGV